jgi:hypothetical protein
LAVDETASPVIVEHVPVEGEGTILAAKPVSRETGRPALATIADSSIAIPLAESKNPKERPVKSIPSPDTERELTLKVTVLSNPSAHAMPVTLPAVVSKFPGGDAYKFPPRNSQEENIRQVHEQPIN